MTEDSHFSGFTLPEDLDPLFLLPDGHRLRLPEQCATERMADWHTHRIARSPKDLTAHVRRVFLFQKLNRAGDLANALADLFIALGPHGQALKARLLHTMAPGLPAQVVEFLSSRVHGTLLATDPLPWGSISTLGQGTSGNQDFINRPSRQR